MFHWASRKTTLPLVWFVVPLRADLISYNANCRKIHRSSASRENSRLAVCVECVRQKTVPHWDRKRYLPQRFIAPPRADFISYQVYRQLAQKLTVYQMYLFMVFHRVVADSCGLSVEESPTVVVGKPSFFFLRRKITSSTQSAATNKRSLRSESPGANDDI